jgi:uncharacterized delta-60 repeat protein
MSKHSTRSSRRHQISAAAFEALEKRELMSAGQLDTSFATGGKFASQILPFSPKAVTMQKDGKMLAAGSYASNFAVARINVNGTIDTAFGPRGDGIAQANFGSGDDTAYDLVVQPNGKIVLVGETGDHKMGVARFNTDGMLDNGFNRGLKEIDFHTFEGSGAAAFAVALQSDGKILVAGREDDSGLIGDRNDDFAVARLNTNGGLDGSFGDDGKVHFGMGGSRDVVNTMYVQHDGKIILGGDANTGQRRRFGVARLKANGDLDKTFDKNGSNLADFGTDTDATMTSIIPGPLDSVVAVGAVNNDFGIARFNNTGALEPLFGNGTGMVRTDVSNGGFDMARTAIITPDNQLLVGGLSNGNFGIARYDIGGTLDTSFGTNGTVNTGFGSTESVYQLSTTPDGKVVALGGSMNNVLQARYTATQPKISVTSSSSTTREGEDKATITFTRDQALSFPTRVYYSLGGTATLTSDYTGPTFTKRIKNIGNVGFVTRGFPLGGKVIGGNVITGGTVITGGGSAFASVPFIDIKAGETEATVKISSVDDTKFEPNETVTATIAADPAYTADTAASTQTVTIEDDDVLHINFQAVSTKGAAGYVRDTGKKFEDRGNGFSYGWEKNIANKMRIRNSAGSTDFRYDSLALMQPGGANHKWELAVPNGRYEVRLVAGDPNSTDSKYKMNLEGQLALEGTPGGNLHWFRSTSIVDVTDGRLTLTNASGAKENKIDFIDIKAAPLTGTPGPVTGASNLPVNLFTNTTQGTRNQDGLFSDTQIDDRDIWSDVRLVRI